MADVATCAKKMSHVLPLSGPSGHLFILCPDSVEEGKYFCVSYCVPLRTKIRTIIFQLKSNISNSKSNILNSKSNISNSKSNILNSKSNISNSKSNIQKSKLKTYKSRSPKHMSRSRKHEIRQSRGNEKIIIERKRK